MKKCWLIGNIWYYGLASEKQIIVTSNKLIKKDKKNNKLIKGVWGMPRLSEAMKDVISCDMLRGPANTVWSADFPMGQPSAVKRHYPDLIGGLTRRTETSKYPEEEKTTVIPQVAASERGKAQTVAVTAAAGL